MTESPAEPQSYLLRLWQVATWTPSSMQPGPRHCPRTSWQRSGSTPVGALSKVVEVARGPLRALDARVTRRIGRVATSCRNMADAILSCYGVEARVIHPPVRLSDYRVAAEPEDFYLSVSRLMSHKRVDLAIEACRRLAERHGPFISRGDQSGTHAREQALWRGAGLTPPGSSPPSWYMESGQGMAATLQMADQKRAYTLTDRATYLAWRDKLQLVPMVEGDSLLFNVYHVMAVNPRNAPRVNTAGGRALADFFVSPEAQALIGAFGRSRFGQSLFVPDAGKPDRW